MSWAGVEPMAARAVEALLAAVWQGAVLAGFVAVSLRLLRGVSAATRSVVWSVVFAVAAMLPVRRMWMSRAGEAGVAAGGWHVGEGWALGLVTVWMGWSMVRAAQLGTSAWRLWGVGRRARVVETATEDVAEILRGAARGLGRGAVLCASDEVEVPCVVGFVRPKVLVPAGMLAELSEGELRQIVLHEMEHVRRWDDWRNLLQKVGVVVFPVNPALVWVERRLCRERELACDDGVLRRTGRAVEYAACLTRLAERRMAQRGLLGQGVSLALGAWRRRSELAGRVQRMLGAQARPISEARAAVAVGVVLGGVLGGATLMARAPELVRFDAGARQAAVLAASQPVSAPMMGMAGARVVPAMMRMPVAVKAAGVKAKRVMRRRVVKKAPARVVLAAESMTRGEGVGGVVLIGWEESMSPRVRMAVDADFTYAAVPVRNGWLIVQL